MPDGYTFSHTCSAIHEHQTEETLPFVPQQDDDLMQVFSIR